MRLRIHPENPQGRFLQQAADTLRSGGIIILPTDTVYALACDLKNQKAYQRMCRLKGVKPDKALFSCMCPDLKVVGEMAIHISTPTFKILKRALPGPYTFILEASKEIPKTFQSRRKTIGVRIPDHVICNELMAALGNPLVVTSLNNDQDDIQEYLADPDEIEQQFGHQVDLILDAGWGGLIPSTIVDCSDGSDDPVVIREGLGSLELL